MSQNPIFENKKTLIYLPDSVVAILESFLLQGIFPLPVLAMGPPDGTVFTSMSFEEEFE